MNIDFYIIFYSILDKEIESILRDTVFKTVEEKKQYVLKHFYTNTLFSVNSHDNLIHMIKNDLSLYLEMVNFVRIKEQPFMPSVLDFTKLHVLFNRFCYHYAKLCINNECTFGDTIYKKINSLPN